MLQYGLTERFARHVSRLPFTERMEVLWKVQGLLSHVPGYLKLKFEADGEDPIYKIGDQIYVLVRDDYESRILVDLSSKRETLRPSEESFKASIVELLSKKELDNETKETFKKALDVHFPIWFINLLALLPKQSQTMLMSDKEADEHEEEKTEESFDTCEGKIAKAEPITEIKSAKMKKPKNDLEGEKFEKEILRQLAKSYELRKKNGKPIQNKPLRHVRFAPKEVAILFSNLGECLFLVQKRTTKLGCKIHNDDWKILLATSVDEYVARQLERRYPNHVCYTDEPDKGELKIALIVKPKKEIKATDELAVKRVASKTASFQKDLPSGAFENIDEEDIPETFYGSVFKPMVRKNIVHISNEVKIERIEEEMEEFFEDDFFEMDFESSISSKESTDFPLGKDEEPFSPSHWHCHLCGKKKLYSGEPAETVKLAGGKIIYLCNKHRGKM